MFFRRHAVMIIATGGYTGRIPFAPGTAGSLVGIPIIYLLSKFSWPVALTVSVLLILVAVWVAGEAERQLASKDPGCVVIDEIAGMVVTMLGLPLSFGMVTAGFLFFRIFDIVKPPPVRQLDRRMSGGWGIVLDDVAAGIMANIVLRMGVHWINR